MKSPPLQLARLLQEFFLNYLPKIRGVSVHTLHAYRDALRLLLAHVSRTHGLPIDRLTVEHLQVSEVLSFLDELERGRGNSAHTRNCRLIALRSFFKHALRQDPTNAEQ